MTKFGECLNSMMQDDLEVGDLDEPVLEAKDWEKEQKEGRGKEQVEEKRKIEVGRGYSSTKIFNSRNRCSNCTAKNLWFRTRS